MNKEKLRKLRFQLLLTVGLLLGSAAMALGIVTQRWFFDKYSRERYKPLPDSLRSLAEEATQGKIDPERFRRLSDESRCALYEDWVSRDEPPETEPKALIAAAPELYLARAERTLVCGNEQQRERALAFLEQAEATDAVPMLQRVADWAARRKLNDLAERVTQTTHRLLPADPASRPERPPDAISSVLPPSHKESEDVRQ